MESRTLSRAVQERTRSFDEKKKNIQETLKMPKGVTTNVQLQQLANRMRIL